MKTFVAIAGIALSLLTSGIIVGLGFVAAAVKFTAVKPSLLDLLDVGRVQFGALHLLEWILVPSACLLLMAGTPKAWKWAAPTALVFLAQMMLVVPPLSARMIARLAEQPLPASSIHEVYVGVALLLSLLLTAQGVAGAWLLVRPQSRNIQAPSKEIQDSSSQFDLHLAP